jgi:hypothetical protein
LRVAVRATAIACRLCGYGDVFEDAARRRTGSEVTGDWFEGPSPAVVPASREGVEGAEDGWIRDAGGIDG